MAVQDVPTVHGLHGRNGTPILKNHISERRRIKNQKLSTKKDPCQRSIRRIENTRIFAFIPAELGEPATQVNTLCNRPFDVSLAPRQILDGF
jgi:hypothetical protein